MPSIWTSLNLALGKELKPEKQKEIDQWGTRYWTHNLLITNQTQYLEIHDSAVQPGERSKHTNWKYWQYHEDYTRQSILETLYQVSRN